MNRFKVFVSACLLLGFSQALWAQQPSLAQQAPLILRDNVLTIPQAVIVDGDNVSYFRNIELAQDNDGKFSIATAENGSLAVVETVEVLRDADRVDVLTRGFRSACVSTLPAAVSYKDGRFVIAIPESKSKTDVCIAQAIRFYAITTLETEGLASGQYTVVVNGVATQFTL